MAEGVAASVPEPRRVKQEVEVKKASENGGLENKDPQPSGGGYVSSAHIAAMVVGLLMWWSGYSTKLLLPPVSHEKRALIF